MRETSRPASMGTPASGERALEGSYPRASGDAIGGPRGRPEKSAPRLGAAGRVGWSPSGRPAGGRSEGTMSNPGGTSRGTGLRAWRWIAAAALAFAAPVGGAPRAFAVDEVYYNPGTG